MISPSPQQEGGTADGLAPDFIGNKFVSPETTIRSPQPTASSAAHHLGQPGMVGIAMQVMFAALI
jgi:hypothetical protein